MYLLNMAQLEVVVLVDDGNKIYYQIHISSESYNSSFRLKILTKKICGLDKKTINEKRIGKVYNANIDKCWWSTLFALYDINIAL